jgi:hypothetical protein
MIEISRRGFVRASAVAATVAAFGCRAQGEEHKLPPAIAALPVLWGRRGRLR